MRTIPKQYISKEDDSLPEVEALMIQYDRWVDDLLDRIRDLEDEIVEMRSQLPI